MLRLTTRYHYHYYCYYYYYYYYYYYCYYYYVAAAMKYPGGRDLSKIFQSAYITFVENIQSRAQQTIQILKDGKFQKATSVNFVTVLKLYIFNNCKLAFDRYEWRLNSVIPTICNYLKTKVNNDLSQLYADIDGYVNPATLFKRRDRAITTNMDDNFRHRARPDIALKNGNQIIAKELTCPHETNTGKSR